MTSRARRPGRRLDRVDLLLTPEDPDRIADLPPYQRLLDTWRERGWLERDSPGAARDALVTGGFARLWLDQRDRPSLFVNRLGGFRVRCPASGANVAGPFGQAVQSWRNGGSRILSCTCGDTHPLENMDLQPPGAIACFAVVFGDARGNRLEPAALSELQEVLGPLRTLLHRVG
ncbi:MAG: hypothetical protein QGG40_09530 [Myxococcota bacterium]|jgi:hypothetical protein|nr:hypothetical protein [Myxococcota bacterium]